MPIVTLVSKSKSGRLGIIKLLKGDLQYVDLGILSVLAYVGGSLEVEGSVGGYKVKNLILEIK